MSRVKFSVLLGVFGLACRGAVDPPPPVSPPPPINHAPVAVAGGPYTSADGAVSFDGSASSDSDGDALTFRWDFGNGATSNLVKPSYTYPQDGNYTVSLVVTDSKGAASAPAGTTAAVSRAVVFVGAGNIATCGSSNDEATAKLLDAIPGTVFTAGDNAFESGTASEYADCYGPTWGRHKARTYAALGNHDYMTPNAAASFDYFGDRAGPRGLGYYSYDLGAWHIIVLNDKGGQAGIDPASPQGQWLAADLLRNTKRCTIAIWHVPLFLSSNTPGWTVNPDHKNVWDALYAKDVDVVINGQQHNYERFAPMNPDGAVDQTRGIRAFNVGTGGESIDVFSVIHPNSETRAAVFGVLKLTLKADSYDWQFVPVAGSAYSDTGVGHVSLSLMPTTAPPRAESTSPAPLVARLGAALASRGVPYCQWKGHGKRERWESGRGDIDLLVDRPAWADFADVLAGLGFKLALPPPGREAAGIVHYFGLDERTGQLIHVHAYMRLVIGLPWRTHYRLPLEQALLDSAVQQAVFKTPAPELEILVLVLRLSLRHALTDPLRRTQPRWLDGALPELDRLEDQTTPEAVRAALARHFPEVSVNLFERCRHALRWEYSPWRRLAVRLELARALAAHAARAPVFALAERVWQRLRPFGQRLVGGGSVVALLGGDGSGKSTCAAALDAWLGSALATLHLHLGRPPRSVTTLVVGAVLKIAQRVGASAHVVAHLQLLRSGCTARDRFRVYRRARRFATAGGIAICERYPTPEGWALAGPSDVQGRGFGATSPLADRLRRWEHRYYDRMTAPDLVFLLQVDPETAVNRKTNEPAAYVRERARLTWETDWSRSGAQIVDATQPLPQVVAALKSQLWRTM